MPRGLPVAVSQSRAVRSAPAVATVLAVGPEDANPDFAVVPEHVNQSPGGDIPEPRGAVAAGTWRSCRLD